MTLKAPMSHPAKLTKVTPRQPVGVAKTDPPVPATSTPMPLTAESPIDREARMRQAARSNSPRDRSAVGSALLSLLQPASQREGKQNDAGSQCAQHHGDAQV